jgi:molybdopterin-guanine dinucleotide biosynthesis protein A
LIKHSCTRIGQNLPIPVVLLAGGRSRRFSGEQKALKFLRGKPLYEHVLFAARSISDPIIIVSKHPEQYASFADLSLQDIHAADTPLAGLVTGISYVKEKLRASHVLVLSCDTLWDKEDFLENLLRYIQPEMGVFPSQRGKLLPFPGIFPVSSLSRLKKHLYTRSFRLCTIAASIPHVLVPSDDLHLMNINTPEELLEAQE